MPAMRFHGYYPAKKLKSTEWCTHTFHDFCARNAAIQHHPDLSVFYLKL